MGKTYITRIVADEFSKRNNNPGTKVAFVRINVWRHQRDLDLHFALLSQILAHPLLLRHCLGAYPAQLLLFPVLSWLSLLLPKGMRFNLRFSQGALDANVAVPLVGQEGFQRVVRRALNNQIRLVVLLDELDRSDPRIAQAACLIARRSLDEPGVLTILPFVETQLNPDPRVRVRSDGIASHEA